MHRQKQETESEKYRDTHTERQNIMKVCYTNTYCCFSPLFFLCHPLGIGLFLSLQISEKSHTQA